MAAQPEGVVLFVQAPIVTITFREQMQREFGEGVSYLRAETYHSVRYQLRENPNPVFVDAIKGARRVVAVVDPYYDRYERAEAERFAGDLKAMVAQIAPDTELTVLAAGPSVHKDEQFGWAQDTIYTLRRGGTRRLNDRVREALQPTE